MRKKWTRTREREEKRIKRAGIRKGIRLCQRIKREKESEKESDCVSVGQRRKGEKESDCGRRTGADLRRREIRQKRDTKETVRAREVVDGKKSRIHKGRGFRCRECEQFLAKKREKQFQRKAFIQ